MSQKYFKEESKKNYFTSTGISNDDLQTGSLMRIADAVEIMTQDRVALERDLKRERESNEYLRESRDKLIRRVTALKGVITKLKNKSQK